SACVCIIYPLSSTIRRASAAYSSGVYGIAGHWSRLATAPEIEQVRMTGSSRLNVWLLGSGTCHSPLYALDGHDAVALPGTLEALALGHLERADDRRARLARVD